MRAIFVSLVFFGGCSHVTLSPAAPEAPLEERQAFYEKYKSKDSGLRALTLTDGSAVYHIDDLYPALPDGSPIEKAAQKSKKYFIPGVATTSVALGLGITAATLFIKGGVTLKQGSDANNEAVIDDGVKKLLIGVGFGVALFPGAIAARYFGGGWMHTRKAVFHDYNSGLQAQLKLCEQSGALSDCP